MQLTYQSVINCPFNFSFLQALRARQKEAVVISSISDIILEYVSETIQLSLVTLTKGHLFQLYLQVYTQCTRCWSRPFVPSKLSKKKLDQPMATYYN